MLTSRVLLVPHWPTMMVDQHRGHRTPMLTALAAQAEQLAAEAPSAIVVLSGRWDSEGPFRVDVGRRHRTLTDYSGLGVEIRYDCPGAPTLARALVDAGIAAGVRVGPAERGVDSGVTVPLHFLAPRPVVPVVPLSTARLPWSECRSWGVVVRRVLAARPERVTFVVGGALSASLHDWSLGREVPQARELDERVLRALSSGAWDELAGIPRALSRRAHPEADLRHLEVLRGFLGGDLAGQVLSHETGPGIGGALVQFDLPIVPGVAPPAPLPAAPEPEPARPASMMTPRPLAARADAPTLPRATRRHEGGERSPRDRRQPGPRAGGARGWKARAERGGRSGGPRDRGPRPDRAARPRSPVGRGPRPDRGSRPGAGTSRGPRPDRGARPGAGSGWRPRPDRGSRAGAGSGRGPRPDRGSRPGAGSGRGPRPDRGSRPGAGPGRGPRPARGPGAPTGRGPRPFGGSRPGAPPRRGRPGAPPGRGPRPGRGTRPGAPPRRGGRPGAPPGRRGPRRPPGRRP